MLNLLMRSTFDLLAGDVKMPVTKMYNEFVAANKSLKWIFLTIKISNKNRIFTT